MARPSEYDFELCKEICDNVALGSNVISVLDSDRKRLNVKKVNNENPKS